MKLLGPRSARPASAADAAASLAYEEKSGERTKAAAAARLPWVQARTHTLRTEKRVCAVRWCGRARGQRGSGAETKATTVAGRERHTRVRAEQKRAAEEEEGERRWKRERASNERLASLCESSAAEWAVAQSALNGATLIHGLVPLLVVRFLSQPSQPQPPNLLVRRSFHISSICTLV